MKKGQIITSDNQLKKILEKAEVIAVLGLSPKPERDSNKVARYLQSNGYKIIPVRPAQKEILGEKAYKTLDDVEKPVDIVNVFRRSDAVITIVEQAVKRADLKLIWMQDGVYNETAIPLAEAAGIPLVMNDCIYRVHRGMR